MRRRGKGTAWGSADVPRGADYDRRFDRLAAAGHDIHGEASFVLGYSPLTLLDAGCGTGRVAIELHRQGVDVVGVDVDAAMLDQARVKEPTVQWYRADISRFRLLETDGTVSQFDIVLTAGNVMIFLEPGTEKKTIRRLADHVAPGGLLISGFQLRRGGFGIDEYDDHCKAAGLEYVDRFANWDRDPWLLDSGYVVAVHEKPGD